MRQVRQQFVKKTQRPRNILTSRRERAATWDREARVCQNSHGAHGTASKIYLIIANGNRGAPSEPDLKPTCVAKNALRLGKDSPSSDAKRSFLFIVFLHICSDLWLWFRLPFSFLQFCFSRLMFFHAFVFWFACFHAFSCFFYVFSFVFIVFVLVIRCAISMCFCNLSVFIYIFQCFMFLYISTRCFFFIFSFSQKCSYRVFSFCHFLSISIPL